jgi:hypothetical protein
VGDGALVNWEVCGNGWSVDAGCGSERTGWLNAFQVAWTLIIRERHFLKHKQEEIPKLNFKLTEIFDDVRVIITLQKIMLQSSRINTVSSTVDVIVTWQLVCVIYLTFYT